MRKSSSEELHQLAIAGGKHSLKDDWDRESAAKRELSRKRGPSEWNTIEPSDFGPEMDYLTVALAGDRTAIVCKSKAALHWCYEKLPEDCPRFSSRGFVIEDKYLDMVEGCMEEDGLMSASLYADAMEEMNSKMREWE